MTLHTSPCHTPRRRFPWIAAFLGSVAVAGSLYAAPTDRSGTEELYRQAAELRAENAAAIEELAGWCQRQGLADQAAKTRQLLGPRGPYKLYLPVLPKEVGPPELPEGASAEVVEWDRRLQQLRREQAGALFDLARRAVRRNLASLAYELALAAVQTNPDNATVRRLFGYQEYLGQWRTAYEVQKLRAGEVWHEKFGWLPKAYVRRYEQGMRYNAGRWITAEEDARLHQDIRRGWVVETEHYAIHTNHSLEAGVALGTKLEDLYRIWGQLFVRYYASEAQVMAMFDGRARSRAVRTRFRVAFFRDREDYNRTLKTAMPNIEMSIGVYLEQTRTAYFFAGEGYEDRTLFHEATHQLFHQSRPVAPNVGRAANFWIIEGIAMYMETLRRQGDYWTLGGFDDQRMYAARYRLLEDNFYVPLEELTAYGMERIHKDSRIATLYSQAAGLTNFLVYYDGGRYRDALVAYLDLVYAGRDGPDTLSQLTGTTYTTLDRQYREWMQGSVRAEAAR